MTAKKSFFRSVMAIALPVTLQSMLQSSFSVVDQIMIGQLGSESIAAVGLAGKFISIFSVVVTGLAAVAAIMIAQYMGQKNRPEMMRSFRINLMLACGIAMIFTALCLLMPQQVMGLYTKDELTRQIAAEYLQVMAWTFLPSAGTMLLAAFFRCVDRPAWPLYASIGAALLNTGLNYLLIFGKWGFAPMGVYGAAVATAVAQIINCLVLILLYRLVQRKEQGEVSRPDYPFHWRQYAMMLLPMVTCEFLWSIGENIYASIYGHLGTEACAAMTLTNPIQSLMIGALCGVSQAAGVIIGKLLGEQKQEEAYRASKKLMLYGLVGSALLSGLLILTRGIYVEIYQVEEATKEVAAQILLAYALVAPFKIQNMIIGGGVLRSGGKTHYVLGIDMMGTWIFGVPLGLLSAFVWKLPIPYVYFILSMEEAVRVLVSLIVFRRKGWMRKLEGEDAKERG